MRHKVHLAYKAEIIIVYTLIVGFLTINPQVYGVFSDRIQDFVPLSLPKVA